MNETSTGADPVFGTVMAVDAIRQRFPALTRHVNGRPIAYFDGPGGTQVPLEVADAVRSYLLEHNANEGWNYPTSHETDAILAHGRAAMADLLDGQPNEIAFGQNSTTLTLRVSRALGRRLGPGDRVVVTELDHHANVDPWKALAAERGVEIRVVRMNPGVGRLEWEDLDAAIDERTRVLAIGAASNALGTITDVTEAAGRAHAVGAVVFVDAVHYAPHHLVDVHALDADFLVVSPYKFYGPHLGVLWGRGELLDELELPRVESAPNRSPDRVETGTLAFEAVVGTTAAVHFLARLAGYEGSSEAVGRSTLRRAALDTTYAALHQRGAALFHRLWSGMNEIPSVRTFGPPPGESRTPTLAFAIHGVQPKAAAGTMANQGLFVTHGDFYATTVIRRLGYAGTGILRAGVLAYTTEDEVDRLLSAADDLSRRGC